MAHLSKSYYKKRKQGGAKDDILLSTMCTSYTLCESRAGCQSKEDTTKMEEDMGSEASEGRLRKRGEAFLLKKSAAKQQRTKRI